VAQTLAALVGFAAYVVITNINNLEVLRQGGEEALPVLAGELILLIGALPFYVIATKILRITGNLKTISYRHLISIGMIHGIILLPSFYLGIFLKYALPSGLDLLIHVLIILAVTGLLSLSASAFIVGTFLRAKTASFRSSN
jgi:hypothetical protein